MFWRDAISSIAVYTYMSISASELSVNAPMAKICGVAKPDFDMTDECVVASRVYSHGCFGSEPFFVPQTLDLNAEEDYEYIVMFTHNENTNMKTPTFPVLW